ncbi:OmpA/MotB domain-containing protein [Oceanimonas sp. GK1]|jgi:outer membrane protein OmpA-like peptidoglycan-associated protein|uniref:OmpA family protein n=1 Tax=Oceanimonas sp. (strain GK1 / IBRC-M 10197) TaxID=511062 RepID=UPI00024951BD|nr:OmpA family protein [Oceanimonas sp. GK1]AEY02305.1 OmpA/MotB domain-containing protein [Oceanimonas sp. GK1]
MKTWILLALVLPLAGCTLTAEPERDTMPEYDLTDLDRDGVITARDNCLDSALNSSVDNDGCGGSESRVLQQDIIVLFAHDKSNIMPKYQEEINRMAAFMAENTELKLLLEGHASQVGTPEYNLALSKRRAQAVRQALVREGVPAERLEIIGYGESKPILMGDDEQSAAANRRVVGALTNMTEGVRMRWNVYSMEPSSEQ